MKSLSCPNRHCPPSRNGGTGAIIRHGFYTTRWGKHRRYQCQACGKTFSTTTGTPYYRLHHRRATFDEVATLSVEGLNKSAIARVKQILGTQCTVGWKEQLPGVTGSIVEKLRDYLEGNFKPMRSELSSDEKINRSGSSS
jgi:transposase-like protein